MAAPGRKDFDLWVGNHLPMTFRLWSGTGTTTAYPMGAYRVDLTVFNGDIELIYKSTVGAPLTVTGNKVDCTLTPADTRTIDASSYEDGVKPRYELEIWDGTTQKTWIWGNFTLKGGANRDV